jgi:arsenite methyltransferase
VENQSGCCSPAMDGAEPFKVIAEPCCTPAASPAASLHEELKTLLAQYDINEAAASVKVYAIKTRVGA